jgi:hypothetical protein
MSRKIMLPSRIFFFIAIFAELAFGLYVLMDWGLDYGWIGIILIVLGLALFTAFFSKVMTKKQETPL